MSQPLLFGVIGSFGPAQLACLRSWRRAGHRTAFFQLGGRRVPFGLRAVVDAYRFYPAGMAPDDVLDAVSEECARLQVTALATLPEALALRLHARQGAGGFATTRLLLNGPDVYRILESKARQAGLAATAGLPVQPTHVLDARSTRLDAAGPFVLRPDVARFVWPPFNARLVDDADAALAVARSLDAPGARLVAQRFVSGPNLIVHAARAADGSWDHHEAFRTEIKSCGLAVALQPYPLPDGLLAACRRFERAVGLSGVFHYDFIVDAASGEAYFLEVNPRLGGTTGKVYAAGYDEPALLAAAHLETGAHRVDLGGPRRPSVSRIAAVRYGLALLRHAPSRLDHPPRRDGTAFGQLARALLLHRDEVFRLTDVAGNSAYLLQAKA